MTKGNIMVGVWEGNAGILRVLLDKTKGGWLWDYVEAEWTGEGWVWRRRGGGNAPYHSGNSTDPYFELGWLVVPSRRKVLGEKEGK